ncbi:CHAP domain-containing protein [Nocardioides KLBMP 9356]|uniref:CHAP domain-containing protein n=1 Tax=Nocardioides potassii TaxID=2911371 RepID=A0ABS9H517_9ACTN|nr:CHAP domain-containing protein [Nocardioides potassii]MCF6376327.1 CHAP domain-containing protein [Nocardioides potassii]
MTSWVGRTTRLAVGALALVLLVTPTTTGRVQLATSTYLCTGYAGCQAAGYGNFGYRTASSTMYWKMYAGHNCTNYVAYRLIQSGMPATRPWEGNGNASNWGVAMASITDQSPRVGAVAWYRSNVSPAGSNGHVAFVEQVISDSEIIVSEDYWGGDFHWRRVTKTGGGWPSGFIHFNDRVVEPTTPPVITGSPAVGSPLAVDLGAWTPTPSSVAVRWLADGAAIPGATSPSYVPTPDVKGKSLTAEVTAVLDGYNPGQASLATAPVAPGTFQRTATPTIQGTPEVGQTLTLTPSAWAPEPRKVTTQWYADGVALDGATGSTLVLDRSHIDKRITARTTASAGGFKKSRSVAAETTPVLAKAVSITRPTVVQGAAKVGSKLVANVGAARPTNATASYRWLRDGKRISGTTRNTYTVRRGDVGHSLSVEVTWTKRYFRDTVESVAVTGPVMAVSDVRVRADVKRSKVTLEVKVKAPGSAKPAGTIAVTLGGRSVEAQVVDGKARVVLKHLKSGTKPLVVRYSGTDLVLPDVARSTVTVAGR